MRSTLILFLAIHISVLKVSGQTLEDLEVSESDEIDEDYEDIAGDFEENEEFIFDKPHVIEKMVQASVRQQHQHGGDVWENMNALADEEAIARVGQRDIRRRDGLKAALLPGGMMAIEGAGLASSALPEAQSVDQGAAEGGATSDDTPLQPASAAKQEQLKGALAVVAEKLSEVAQQVSTGEVALAGAFSNLPEDYTGEDDSRPAPFMMTAWYLATQQAESASVEVPAAAGFPTDEDQAFQEWFAENGGELSGVKYSEVRGKVGGMRGLLATADLQEDEPVVTVPLRACLSLSVAATIRTSGGWLNQILKDAFEQSEEWGLALILLYEHFQDHHKGGNSRFKEYTRTLRTYELGKKVMQELQGTYAAEFKKVWEEECETSYQWLSQNLFGIYSNVFMRDPNRHQAGPFNREDWRWAFGVVRRRAVRVTRMKSGLQFLALCPFADLIPHSGDVLGNITLSLDNLVRVTTSPHSAGAEVYVNRGPLSDAATLFKYHSVMEGDNPENRALIKLPGVGGYQKNIVHRVEMIRKWREEMQLPPRAADLWRAADTLQLYGSQEEQDMLAPAEDPHTLEWPGMGAIALSNEVSAVQMYSANLFSGGDGDANILAKDASKSLARAAVQLQESVAATTLQQSSDPSIISALNATKNFFFYGMAPVKGLDELDRVLVRKMEMMERCGTHDDMYLTWWDVRPSLLCGIRLVLANESDIMEFYQAVGGSVLDMRLVAAETGGFNWTLPISRDNELATLDSLMDSVDSLMRWYPTSMEEDEALLTLSTLGRRVRAAVTVRLREKRMLQSAMHHIRDLKANVGNLTYQVELRQQARERRAQEVEEAAERERERLERLREYISAKDVAEISVDLGLEEPVKLVVKERESLDVVVADFASKYRIGETDINVLKAELRKKMQPVPVLIAALPVVHEDGSHTLLSFKEGENITGKVDEYVDVYGLGAEYKERLLEAATNRVERRTARRKIVQLPISSPDGRTLHCALYEGEQHDPSPVAREFLEVWGLDLGAVQQLAQALLSKLPPARVVVPINLGERGIMNFRLADGEEMQKVVRTFMEVNEIPEESFQQLIRAVNKKLYPGAVNL
ncbi:hypothetical protein CYMTET_42624 [Cymbomonas tetramitiformis]|uniref:Rubisco LSMT substrate-binding domain-containing protein n=1 Tax=Cymbomonas tetramitiformis TaxID=36881 RepID=A0AAE0C535_9CHLO|nr:hypothetical protein CYMTET_42624 [Cymbomonas tetramitiformis]